MLFVLLTGSLVPPNHGSCMGDIAPDHPGHEAGRRIRLMQDPLHRNDVTRHTMGYTGRPYPMTSYYLGAK